VRRVSDRRAERRVDRVLRYPYDPDNCAPAELARNETDRATFFALVRDWRSELS
jgi:hypothetical protein